MKTKLIFLFVAMAFSLSLTCFGQDCDKLLNRQTNAVNTKGIVLKALGRLVDGVAGTNFSKLSSTASDQLQMFDAMLYNTCLQLQTVKSDGARENMEEKTRNIAIEMLKLLRQSDSLTPDVVNLLAENGVITPSAPGSDTPAPVNSQPAPVTPPASADDVPPPVLPTPPSQPSGGSFESRTLPCQQYATTKANDVVFRAMMFETHRDPQIANTIAYTTAIEKLAKSVEVAINSSIDFYASAVNEDSADKELKLKIGTIVDRTLRGVRIVCEEYLENTATQRWRCFVALEIDKDAVLKPVHDALKQDGQLGRALPSYEKLKKTTGDVFTFDEQMGF